MDIQQFSFGYGDGTNKLNNNSTIAKVKPNTETAVSIVAGKGSKRKPKNLLKSQVKKIKIQITQNFTMETVFDRFPTLCDEICTFLDEKSLANCVEVNRKWQNTIANQKVYLKKKIKKWSKHCNKSDHSG